MEADDIEPDPIVLFPEESPSLPLAAVAGVGETKPVVVAGAWLFCRWKPAKLCETTS